MPYDRARHTGGLRRLSAEYYQGFAHVHWSMTVDQRAVGWLDPLHHATTRELLCHSLSQSGVVCPAYCLMPDHAHFLWMGTTNGSDQHHAVRHFRAQWNRELRQKDLALQKQAYDHVLTKDERQPDRLKGVVEYIFLNPVRAGLTDDWRKYPYSGCVVPGYPELSPRADDFWDRFWRLFVVLTAKSAS